MAVVTVEVWLMIDDCGDYCIAKDADGLGEAYENDVQDLESAGGLRRVKVTVTIPLPKPLEVEATAPADDGQASADQSAWVQ
jgi:hypothetical protein